MSPGFGRFASSAAAIIAAHVLFSVSAPAATRRMDKGLTRIAPSGVTVVRQAFREGRVTGRIHTVTLADEGANTCPSSRFVVKAFHAKQVTVVTELRISVNGHPITYVPTSAYASLYDPQAAQLMFDRGRFVLKIYANADGASEGYFVLLYFNSKAVTERREYSDMDEQNPTEVTHFYTVTVGR